MKNLPYIHTLVRRYSSPCTLYTTHPEYPTQVHHSGDKTYQVPGIKYENNHPLYHRGVLHTTLPAVPCLVFSTTPSRYVPPPGVPANLNIQHIIGRGQQHGGGRGADSCERAAERDGENSPWNPATSATGTRGSTTWFVAQNHTFCASCRFKGPCSAQRSLLCSSPISQRKRPPPKTSQQSPY